MAGTVTGTVAALHVRAVPSDPLNDALDYVVINGTPSGRPVCATSPYWMIRDAKSAAGEQQLAMLMTAKATGRPVTIIGANTCLRWGDGEDIYEIQWSN